MEEHPDEHHHVAFAPPSETDTYNHDEHAHAKLESPPPPPHAHVAFAPPSEIDTYNHDDAHAKLESPPPHPDASTSPPITPSSKKLDTSTDALLIAPIPKMAEIEKNVSSVSALSSDVDALLSPDETMDAEALLLASAAAATPESLSQQHKLSNRSTNSADPSTATSNTSKFASRQLRGNLTRTQKNRDPLTYYEITQVLGVGSMGSVAKVRKRATAIGGSARKTVQDRVKLEQKIDACFRVPLVGGLFAFCLRNKADEWLEEVSAKAEIAGTSGDGTSTIATQASSTEMIYAMKSIHLSRITDDAFIEELRNEISILKTLDHPHIVKAIETFDHRNQLFVIMELCSGGDLCTCVLVCGTGCDRCRTLQ